MNYYETLYIVHPALESGRLKDIILSIQESCNTMDVNILSTNVWGKKKLSYLIDKQKYGTYVLVQYRSDTLAINKIAQELEHNPNILSYLTTRIDEADIDKDLSSLDEQINGGKSKTSETKSDTKEDKADLEPENQSEDNSTDKESSVESDESSVVKDDELEKSNDNSEEKNGTN